MILIVNARLNQTFQDLGLRLNIKSTILKIDLSLEV